MKHKIAIVYLIVVVLLSLAISIPNYVGSRVNPANICIFNLRLIDAAKQEWASDNHKTNGPVTWNDIQPYLSRVSSKPIVGIPHCPKNGTYTLGNIEELPKCSIAKHSLNSNEQ